MALSDDALTTVEQVKNYLQIASSDHDDLFEQFIEAVSSQFMNYTGRKLTARDYSPDGESADYDPDNAVLSGHGHPELILPQYPVVSVSAVSLDGVFLTAAEPGDFSGWLVDKSAGVLVRLDGVFTRGQANVLVTYRAGFATVPPDLAQAAVMQSAVRFQDSAAGHGRLGITARTLADGSVSYTDQALLPQVKEILDRYRNRSLL